MIDPDHGPGRQTIGRKEADVSGIQPSPAGAGRPPDRPVPPPHFLGPIRRLSAISRDWTEFSRSGVQSPPATEPDRSPASTGPRPEVMPHPFTRTISLADPGAIRLLIDGNDIHHFRSHQPTRLFASNCRMRSPATASRSSGGSVSVSITICAARRPKSPSDPMSVIFD